MIPARLNPFVSSIMPLMLAAALVGCAEPAASGAPSSSPAVPSATSAAPAATAEPLQQRFTGEWEAPEVHATLRITALDTSKLRIVGKAYWIGTVPGAVNYGDLDEPFVVQGNVAVQAAKAKKNDCSVTVTLGETSLLVQDNDACGGNNVTFSGKYRRASPAPASSAAPPASASATPSRATTASVSVSTAPSASPPAAAPGGARLGRVAAQTSCAGLGEQVDVSRGDFHVVGDQWVRRFSWSCGCATGPVFTAAYEPKTSPVKVRICKDPTKDTCEKLCADNPVQFALGPVLRAAGASDAVFVTP